jgi:hypothetical protein|tara:strand:- start:1309 stop:1953 length:645 start_codon:yes stop_codon:yes gene_type:complete
MIDYGTVYSRVDEFLQTREGLASPKKAQDYNVFVKELTGIFCGAGHENEISTKSVVNFLDIAQDHFIENIVNTGNVSRVCDLISQKVKDHKLYYIVEHTLMKYKPASVQVGPGEFFMCFYDAGSIFGVDPTAGFDIVVDGMPTELKSHGTNLTTPELFDRYVADPNCERLLVVKPVSDSYKPRDRSLYSCINVDKWREAFYHRHGKKLLFKEVA